MLCQDSKLHRFQIMIKPDLSSASLYFRDTPTMTLEDFEYVYARVHDYKMCDDSLFSCDTFPFGWYRDSALRFDAPGQLQCGMYTGSAFTRFLVSHRGPSANIILPEVGLTHQLLSCPASGRFVVELRDEKNSLVIFDFIQWWEVDKQGRSGLTDTPNRFLNFISIPQGQPLPFLTIDLFQTIGYV
jgi:hypothetical protein